MLEWGDPQGVVAVGRGCKKVRVRVRVRVSVTVKIRAPVLVSGLGLRRYGKLVYLEALGKKEMWLTGFTG